MVQDDFKRYDGRKKKEATFQKRKNRIRQSDKLNCTDYIPETIENKAN